jgi:hypothetical protein
MNFYKEKNMSSRKVYVNKFHISCVVLLIASLTFFNVHVNTCWANDNPKINDEDKLIVASAETSSEGDSGNETSKDVKSQEPQKSAPKPKETSSGNTLLYSGIGVAAIVGIAVAAGSGGGSDSAEEAPPPEPTPVVTTKTIEKSKPKIKKPSDSNPPGSEPVGPDIRGDNWSGYLALVHGKRENVSASIHQNGNYVVITTSSGQKYGRKFVGNISDSGSIRVYDQATGELWTTHSGPAKKDRIDLYDFVDNFKDLDRLYLER